MILKLLRSTLVFSCVILLASCSNFNKKGGGAGDAGSDSDTVGGTPLPFAFDSYAIDPADDATLQSVAQFLQGNPNTIIIAGFTDERGTPEYNRGLGESRAEAVRDYLVHQGADASKLQTVSFGAEMPVDPGSDEDAWAKNRRAEFGVVK